MKINITQKDINKGEKANGDRCPIARAIKRAMPFKNIWYKYEVGRILVMNRFGNTVFELPVEAVKFIRDYDGGHPVEPFSFEV